MFQHLTYEQLDKLFDFFVRLYLDQLTEVVDERKFVTAMHVARNCPPITSSDETKLNECMDDWNVCKMHVCDESRLMNTCSVGKDTSNINLPKSDKSSSSPCVSNSFIDETKQDNTFTFVSISAKTIEKSYIKIKRNRGRPRKLQNKHYQ